MPNGKYKSITVSETVFDNFYKAYEKIKEPLKEKGIFSFSAYFESLMVEVLEDIKISYRFRDVTFFNDLVIFRDYWLGQMVEVEILEDGIWCKTCKREDCLHIGFLYSVPKTYQLTVKVR